MFLLSVRLPEPGTQPYKIHDILKCKYTGMTYHMKSAAPYVVQRLDCASKI